jgi:hypothetical protein
MNKLQKYSGYFIIFLMIVLTFTKDKIWLFYFGIAMIFLFILFGIYDLIMLKNVKILDAVILNFNQDLESDIGKNVNFDLEISFKPSDQQVQLAKIKGLYLRNPKIGENIKIILNQNNFNESKIYTGTEAISSLIQIVVLASLFIFLCFLKVKNIINI